MIAVGFTVAVAVVLLLPHAIPLHRIAPMTAATVWALALALRALVAATAALFTLVYLPQTGAFVSAANWCLHEVLPIVSAHLSLYGHPLAHVAVVLPSLALAGSACWLLVRIARGWIALRDTLSSSLGEGPLGSTVVRDDEIVVAVTSIGRSRVLVSDAALRAMDLDELRASLAHETGHVRRRHRPLILGSSLLAAVGRFLPGTQAAERGLLFNLERDADEFAIRTTNDPLALASAICKAATGRAIRCAVALQGRGGITMRLSYLVDGSGPDASRGLEQLVRCLVVLMAALTLGLAASLVTWAADAPGLHVLAASLCAG